MRTSTTVRTTRAGSALAGSSRPAASSRRRRGMAVGGGGLEHVGALQVVVLQRRLDDLVQEAGLVLAVGLHRIEMLGALGEGGVQDVLAALGSRIGVVPDRRRRPPARRRPRAARRRVARDNVHRPARARWQAWAVGGRGSGEGVGTGARAGGSMDRKRGFWQVSCARASAARLGPTPRLTALRTQNPGARPHLLQRPSPAKVLSVAGF